ncbi:unnamed protein product [Dicrocoelium dendriticum]|nr:unnamed protein product [Dicrocoelium dendriticum]
MPSPVSEGVIAPETQHQLYKSSNTNDNFPTSDPWQLVTSGYRAQQPGEVYPYAFSNQQLTSFDQGRSHFSAPDSSGLYAFGLGSHRLVKEPYVAATYRPQLSNIPRVQAAVPASSSQQPPLWSAYTLGDLSSVDSTGSTSHLYSGLRTAAVERKLARASKNKGSNGIGSIRSGGGRIRDKFRSNVHKATLVSQLHLSHLRGKWPSGAAVTGSKHLGLVDNVDELGFNIRHTVGGAGEGYCNMNVILTSFLTNADLSLGAARSEVHRQRRVEHDRNGAFISLFPPVKNIRFPTPGPPVTGWAHLFSNLEDTNVQSTVVPEEAPQTVYVFHSSKQRDSSSHVDNKLPSVTATIFHPIPYTEPFRWQFGQEDLATTFPSSVLVPRRQSQNGPKTRQMSGPSSVGAKKLPHINELLLRRRRQLLQLPVQLYLVPSSRLTTH